MFQIYVRKLWSSNSEKLIKLNNDAAPHWMRGCCHRNETKSDSTEDREYETQLPFAPSVSPCMRNVVCLLTSFYLEYEYWDGRSQIKVHTEKRTQARVAQCSLAVTHPCTNRGRCMRNVKAGSAFYTEDCWRMLLRLSRPTHLVEVARRPKRISFYVAESVVVVYYSLD